MVVLGRYFVQSLKLATFSLVQSLMGNFGTSEQFTTSWALTIVFLYD